MELSKFIGYCFKKYRSRTAHFKFVSKLFMRNAKVFWDSVDFKNQKSTIFPEASFQQNFWYTNQLWRIFNYQWHASIFSIRHQLPQNVFGTDHFSHSKTSWTVWSSRRVNYECISFWVVVCAVAACVCILWIHGWMMKSKSASGNKSELSFILVPMHFNGCFFWERQRRGDIFLCDGSGNIRNMFTWKFQNVTTLNLLVLILYVECGLYNIFA